MESLHQSIWENKAKVRTKSRVLLDPNTTGFFYPCSRQPLSVHPLVEKLGPKALDFLLTQSFYKYTNDISIIETKVVNQAILSVFNNTLSIPFNSEQKINLYTIMIDETYHAYVAYDAMLQVQTYTGIDPMSLPSVIEIELAIQAVKTKLAPQYHKEFELVAICLAENTITKDMMTMLDQKEVHPFFQQHIFDHYSDETRHAGIFFQLLKYLWATMNEDYRHSIGLILPEFLTLYLNSVVQKEFEKRVLIQMGLALSEVDEVMEDTYAGFQITRYHPMLKNILSILMKADVFDDVISIGFRERQWIL